MNLPFQCNSGPWLAVLYVGWGKVRQECDTFGQRENLLEENASGERTNPVIVLLQSQEHLCVFMAFDSPQMQWLPRESHFWVDEVLQICVSMGDSGLDPPEMGAGAVTVTKHGLTYLTLFLLRASFVLPAQFETN